MEKENPQDSEKASKYQPIVLAAISAIAGVITTFIATSPALWGSNIDSLKEDIQELQNENAELSKQITELRNQNSELSKTIGEQDKTVQNYQEIAKNPAMAMVLLPYLLKALSLGPADNTIDCTSSYGGATKELACRQIQTLLYYIDQESYQPEVPMEEVKENIARYQRDENLRYGESKATAGMLDKPTLTRLIQHRLDMMHQDETEGMRACEFFPEGC